MNNYYKLLTQVVHAEDIERTQAQYSQQEIDYLATHARYRTRRYFCRYASASTLKHLAKHDKHLQVIVSAQTNLKRRRVKFTKRRLKYIREKVVSY